MGCAGRECPGQRICWLGVHRVDSVNLLFRGESMARRILNRRELREEADAAERVAESAEEAVEVEEEAEAEEEEEVVEKASKKPARRKTRAKVARKSG